MHLNKFVTKTMPNTKRPETHLRNKPHYDFVAQTMLDTNEPETLLSYNP